MGKARDIYSIFRIVMNIRKVVAAMSFMLSFLTDLLPKIISIGGKLKALEITLEEACKNGK